MNVKWTNIVFVLRYGDETPGGVPFNIDES